MLVKVDVYDADKNRWTAHAMLEIETAVAVYPFEMPLAQIERAVSKGYACYATANYYKTFWDEEFEEHFTVETSKPLRITKHVNQKSEIVAEY